MRKYPNAPIVEAVIEFRLRFDNAPTVDALDRFCTGIADRFPTKVPVNVMAVQLAQQAGDQPQLHGNNSQIGFRLTSVENDRVAMIQQDSFIYSHLAPYSDWDTFSDELKFLWLKFSESLAPKAVIRVATRYINRIVVPQSRVELKDYFTIGPELPAAMAEHLSGFFVQLQLPLTDLHAGARSVINFSPQPSSPDTCAFVLDIDTFREDEFAPDSGEIWEFLNHLRLKKDEIFESSITDKTRKLFQ